VTPAAVAVAAAAAGAAVAAVGCQPAPASPGADPCAFADGFSGCLFYFADTDNTDQDDGRSLSLFVTSSAGGARLAVQSRDTQGAWRTDQIAMVAAGGAIFLALTTPDGRPLDIHREGTGPARGRGRRLRADRPVTAAIFNSDGRNGSSASSSATLLPPREALGLEYRALGWPEPSPEGMVFASGPLPATIVVVGTRDGTTAVIEAEPAPLSFALDDGDVFQWVTTATGSDLSGVRVTADAPVAVLSGVACAADGRPDRAASESRWCDKIEEALLPTATWGRSYVATPLPPRPEACDGRPGWPFAHRYRVVAAEDDTELAFDTPEPSPRPGEPPAFDRIPRAGGFREYETPGPFFVRASKPVAIAELVPCEPSMVLLAPVERWDDQSIVAGPSLLPESIVIARKAGSHVVFDGLSLEPSLWSAAGGGFEVTTLAVADCGAGRFGRAPSDLSGCVHRLAGESATALIGANDFLGGYAYGGTYRLAR